MLDLHVIMHSSNPDWFNQCRDSIDVALTNCTFPVAIRYVDGETGHIGKGRAYGYSLGENPYVTCVDDDDYLLPYALCQMKESLLSGVTAISTPELILQNGCFDQGKKRHHLIAYKRECIIDHTEWKCCGDVAQMFSVSDWHDLPAPGYVHRVYNESQARVMRRERPEELRDAYVKYTA